MATSILFVIVSIIVIGLGAFLGFGSVLKNTTKGIFGVIISIFVCGLIGGALLATPAIGNWIATGNNSLTGFWRFLGVINIFTIIYFVILFVVVQSIRMAIVSIINMVFEIEVWPISIINRILGGAYLAAFAFFMLLLILACLKTMEINFGLDTSSGLKGVLFLLYQHNPIIF